MLVCKRACVDVVRFFRPNMKEDPFFKLITHAWRQWCLDERIARLAVEFRLILQKNKRVIDEEQYD